MLVKPAYRAVVAAIDTRVAGLPRVAMDPFEYCYNWTSMSTGRDRDDVDVPKLALHFTGSAQMEPLGKSYVIDAAPGVKCIGVQEGPWPEVSIVGRHGDLLRVGHLLRK